MSPGAERFAAKYPVVWHVIEAEGLPAIERFGLLPATDLRAMAGGVVSNANRDDFALLLLANGMPAVLRFQQMHDERLSHSLRGTYAERPNLWRAMIDRRVFFWATQDRRDKFMRATQRERKISRAAPSEATPIVLAFTTADLLRAHEKQAVYSTFNTGSTVLGGYKKARDEHTFLSVTEYMKDKAAELAIEGKVDPAIPFTVA